MADQMRDPNERDNEQQGERTGTGGTENDLREQNPGPAKQQGDGFRGADSEVGDERIADQGTRDAGHPAGDSSERGGEGGYGGSSGWTGGSEGATDDEGSSESGARRRDREQSGGSGSPPRGDAPEPREGMRSTPSQGGSQMMPEGDTPPDRASDVVRERPQSPPDLH